MSTAILPGILLLALMTGPVLLWGQDRGKTDRLFNTLAVAPKKTNKVLLLYRSYRPKQKFQNTQFRL